MKLGKGTYDNFGSHRSLSFSYDHLGLCLVSGPTGSGKSTLMDAPAWALFGITSKEGAVDEVKSWGADEPTRGEQEVELSDGQTITVVRVRGSSRQNDLYWIEPNGEQKRGKDVKETQDLLETRLGVTAELYLLGAYFTQFSRADSFFAARAKDRRDTLERIADLSLPVHLAERAAEARKEAKDALSVHAGLLERLKGGILVLSRQVADAQVDSAAWEHDRAEELVRLRDAGSKFEGDKHGRLADAFDRMEALDARITDPELLRQKLEENAKALEGAKAQEEYVREAERALNKLEAEAAAIEKELNRHARLGDTCPTCLGSTKGGSREMALAGMRDTHEKLLHRAVNQHGRVETEHKKLEAFGLLQSERSALISQEIENTNLCRDFAQAQKDYARIEAEENTYVRQIIKLETSVNPHKNRIKVAQEEITLNQAATAEREREVAALEHRVAQLSLVYDLSFELRGQLLLNAVQQIQSQTNRMIEKYFEGEIQVTFSLDADKLEVEIQKSGHECSFRQLSGGQRRILTLAFAVSLMDAAASKAGVHFENLFFDEALNGLDDGLKTKAFGLFEELSTRHGTVMLIEHAEEMKGLFSRKYTVSLNSDFSEVEELD